MTVLVLVPTALERSRLPGLEALAATPTAGLALELCGFGPLAAAARTAALLARLAPREVHLVGIAGSFDLARLPLGRATTFGEVRLDGVGAGHGPDLLAPSDLGLPQWDGPPGPVHERLPLRLAPGQADGPALLTVAAASGDAAHAAERRARHPGALAEDMEAFGVALACHLAGVPLTVTRGCSNAVGDRATSGWQLGPALAAAETLLLDLLTP